MLLWERETNTYAKNDAEISMWLNALLIASLTDELNIQFNEKFDLLLILDQGGIVRLKLMLNEMFFMYETVLQTLNTRIKQFYQEGPSKTVGENKALFMLQFLACSVHISDVKNLSIEADT